MPTNKITLAQISWSDEGVPVSEQFEDYYYSTDDGLAEIDHNFITPNHLLERFKALQEKQTFRIVETGFGSGLNFIKTLSLWLQNAPKSAQCHFISVEKYPMSLTDLKQSHTFLTDPNLIEVAHQLCEQYPTIFPGWHDVYLFDNRVRLTLWFGDALKGLVELSASNRVDAWFLDGFAPAKNPQMWLPAIYQNMARLSHLNTTFSTFTAAGDVRRNLAKVGFKVEKKSGFGKKREVCFGQLQQQRDFSLKAPWYARPPALQHAFVNDHAQGDCSESHDARDNAKNSAKNNAKQSKIKPTVIVVGAGLAGAAVAYKLAKEGWHVIVLEAESAVATQASGNLAGTVHPLVTVDWNLRSQWYLLGFQQTLKNTMPWLKQNSQSRPQPQQNAIGELDGLVELLVDEAAENRATQALQRVGLPSDWVSLLNAEQASSKLGTATPYSGLYFSQGGWLYPKALIERCLAHENVHLFTHTQVTDFTLLENSANESSQLGNGENWQVTTQITTQATSHASSAQSTSTQASLAQTTSVQNDATGKVNTTVKTFQASAVVVATGSLANDLNERLGLPIRPVKGQVTHLKKAQEQQALQKAVTHGGYSVSMPDGAVTGATFEAPDMSVDLSQQGHQENLATAQRSLPDWFDVKVSADDVAGRIAFRPTTPDHLPIIGPVACPQWMSEKYLTQSHTHAVYRYAEQRYQSGLFVSNGHGPRGLMSVFLAAEIIYADMVGEALPMPLSLYHASHPARFKIRHWRSGKS